MVVTAKRNLSLRILLCRNEEADGEPRDLSDDAHYKDSDVGEARGAEDEEAKSSQHVGRRGEKSNGVKGRTHCRHHEPIEEVLVSLREDGAVRVLGRFRYFGYETQERCSGDGGEPEHWMNCPNAAAYHDSRSCDE